MEITGCITGNVSHSRLRGNGFVFVTIIASHQHAIGIYAEQVAVVGEHLRSTTTFIGFLDTLLVVLQVIHLCTIPNVRHIAAIG